MVFIIIHGSFGHPDDNWFPDLRADLEALGQKVFTPQFPVDDWEKMIADGPDKPLKNQSLSNWLTTFKNTVLPQIPKDEKIVFVGHSLGPLFILHTIEQFDIKADCAIFVSPFLDRLDRWEFNHANATFYKTDFDFEKLKKNLPVSYVLYSDNDPYVTKNHSLLFARMLDSSTIMVKKAGHMNANVNLNEFPLVRDLCYSRLDLSLYQRFLQLHKKQTAQEYITENKNRGIIRLKPGDVISEGIFHFRNMTRDGFCTLYTGIQKYWDPVSDYMQHGREAAQRVNSFIRVIVLDKLNDANKPELHQQIKLDLASGIKIYLVLWNQIKNEVKEPDFGIWDHDYVCIVRVNPDTHKVEEAELNSRTTDINRYEKWREYILKKAFSVDQIDDIQKFIAINS